MTQNATSAAQGCIFCAVVARQAEASVVYEDEAVVVFMDLNPVTPGHLLVVPRKHAAGLEDLDGATSAHVWSVGHDMARALRRSGMRCGGINVFLCDGEVAFQAVFHFHLHVIPRYAGDGWTIIPESASRSRRSAMTFPGRGPPAAPATGSARLTGRGPGRSPASPRTARRPRPVRPGPAVRRHHDAVGACTIPHPKKCLRLEPDGALDKPYPPRSKALSQLYR